MRTFFIVLTELKQADYRELPLPELFLVYWLWPSGLFTWPCMASLRVCELSVVLPRLLRLELSPRLEELSPRLEEPSPRLDEPRLDELLLVYWLWPSGLLLPPRELPPRDELLELLLPRDELLREPLSELFVYWLWPSGLWLPPRELLLLLLLPRDELLFERLSSD